MKNICNLLAEENITLLSNCEHERGLVYSLFWKISRANSQFSVKLLKNSTRNAMSRTTLVSLKQLKISWQISNRLLAFNASSDGSFSIDLLMMQPQQFFSYYSLCLSMRAKKQDLLSFFLFPAKRTKVRNQTAPGNKKIAVLQKIDNFSSPRMRRLTTRSLAHPVRQF